MKEILYSIGTDVKGERNILFDGRELVDLRRFVGIRDNVEFEVGLLTVAAKYIRQINRLQNEVNRLDKENKVLHQQSWDVYKNSGKDYKSLMKDKIERGICPADKKVNVKDIEDMFKMGMSRQQICDELGISRTTLWRKMKEATTLPHFQECLHDKTSILPHFNDGLQSDIATLPDSEIDFSKVRLKGLE